MIDHSGAVDPDAAFMAVRRDLVRLAFSMTRSREDAEDVVQEVWLRWRRHHTSVAAAPQWLRTVTRNVAVDRLRACSADRVTTCDVATLPDPSAASATPAVEAAMELQPAFDAVLGSLSPLERVVFVLHDGLDWSYPDIARLLARSEAAVRQLRHRAQQHLASGSRRVVVDPAVVDATATAYVRRLDGL